MDSSFVFKKASQNSDYKPIDYKPKNQKTKPKISVDIKEGDFVLHDVFGKGRVLSISRNIATVKFEDKERSIVKEFLRPV